MIALAIAFLGLCAGSLTGALTYRIKTGKDWVRGRSQCPRCGHQLAAKDLAPLYSWVSLKGKCRYCAKPISASYPLVEIAGGLVFLLSYWLWPAGLSTSGQKLLLAGWLLSFTCLLAIAVYDWLYSLMPNILLLPAVLIAGLSRLIYIIAYSHTLPAICNKGLGSMCRLGRSGWPTAP